MLRTYVKLSQSVSRWTYRVWSENSTSISISVDLWAYPFQFIRCPICSWLICDLDRRVTNTPRVTFDAKILPPPPSLSLPSFLPPPHPPLSRPCHFRAFYASLKFLSRVTACIISVGHGMGIIIFLTKFLYDAIFCFIIYLSKQKVDLLQ